MAALSPELLEAEDGAGERDLLGLVAELVALATEATHVEPIDEIDRDVVNSCFSSLPRLCRVPV